MTRPNSQTEGNLDVLLIGQNDLSFHKLGEIEDTLIDVLEDGKDVEVVATTDKDALLPDNISQYDVVVDYMTDSSMNDDQFTGLSNHVRDGKGYLGIHCASMLEATENTRSGRMDELEDLVGGAYLGTEDPQKISIDIENPDHVVTQNIDSYETMDELYQLRTSDDLDILATGDAGESRSIPVAWTKEYGDGRVFYHSGGHDRRAFSSPEFQKFIGRGLSWVSRRI